jgi:hypothetical protein
LVLWLGKGIHAGKWRIHEFEDYGQDLAAFGAVLQLWKYVNRWEGR